MEITETETSALRRIDNQLKPWGSTGMPISTVDFEAHELDLTFQFITCLI